MRSLLALEHAADRLPPVSENRCGIQWPLRVFAINGVALTPPAVVRCPVAVALAEWLRDVVQPAAEANLGARIARLHTAGSYVCRSRNGAPGRRLSEHSIGNAIDVASFETSRGETVVVRPGHQLTTAHAQFLTAARKGACEVFYTVLGPGSDASHADHFHLDLARRGRSGRTRYCR